MVLCVHFCVRFGQFALEKWSFWPILLHFGTFGCGPKRGLHPPKGGLHTKWVVSTPKGGFHHQMFWQMAQITSHNSQNHQIYHILTKFTPKRWVYPQGGCLYTPVSVWLPLVLPKGCRFIPLCPEMARGGRGRGTASHCGGTASQWCGGMSRTCA